MSESKATPTGHALHFELNQSFAGVTAKVRCHEPEGAHCRLTCMTAACDGEGCDHQPADYGKCGAVEWFDSDGDHMEHYDGPWVQDVQAGAAVVVVWDGIGVNWSWHLAEAAPASQA